MSEQMLQTRGKSKPPRVHASRKFLSLRGLPAKVLNKAGIGRNPQHKLTLVEQLQVPVDDPGKQAEESASEVHNEAASETRQQTPAAQTSAASTLLTTPPENQTQAADQQPTPVTAPGNVALELGHSLSVKFEPQVLELSSTKIYALPGNIFAARLEQIPVPQKAHEIFNGFDKIRFNGDLDPVKKKIDASSKFGRSGWVDDPADIRMIGRAIDGEDGTVALLPTICIRCAKKHHQMIRKRLQASCFDWAREIGFGEFLVADAAQLLALTDHSPSFAQTDTTLNTGLELSNGMVLQIHIQAAADIRAANGLLCRAVLMRRDTVVAENFSRLGGVLVVDGRRVGITSAHRILNDMWDELARPQSSTEHSASLGARTDEGSSLFDDSDDSTDGTAEDSPVTDYSCYDKYRLLPHPAWTTPTNTDWHEVKLGDIATFAGTKITSVKIPDAPDCSLAIDDFVKSDFALIDLGRIEETLVNEYHNEENGIQIPIRSVVAANDLQPGPVKLKVLLGNDGAIDATLLDRQVSLGIRSVPIETRMIALANPLPQGSSGAWVVRDDCLYGMIIAGYQHEPYAYMILAGRLLSDVKNSIPDAKEVDMDRHARLNEAGNRSGRSVASAPQVKRQEAQAADQEKDASPRDSISFPNALFSSRDISQAPQTSHKGKSPQHLPPRGLQANRQGDADSHRKAIGPPAPAVLRSVAPSLDRWERLEVPVRATPADVLFKRKEILESLSGRTILSLSTLPTDCDGGERSMGELGLEPVDGNVAWADGRRKRVPGEFEDYLYPEYLAKLDSRGFNRRVFFHMAFGLFVASYALSAINIIGPAFRYVELRRAAEDLYPYDALELYERPDNEATWRVVLLPCLPTLIGMATGMLGIGIFADRYGRRAVSAIPHLYLTVGMTALTATDTHMESSALSAWLGSWQFCIGLGIGAEFTIASVMVAELSPARWRLLTTVAIFSTQSLAQLVAYGIGVGVFNSLPSSYIDWYTHANLFAEARDRAIRSVDTRWRVLMLYGALTALVTAIVRLISCLWSFPRYGNFSKTATARWLRRICLPESPRFWLHVRRNRLSAEKAANIILDPNTAPEMALSLNSSSGPNASPSSPRAASKLIHWLRDSKTLLALSLLWFLLYTSYFALGLDRPRTVTTIWTNELKTRSNQTIAAFNETQDPFSTYQAYDFQSILDICDSLMTALQAACGPAVAGSAVAILVFRRGVASRQSLFIFPSMIAGALLVVSGGVFFTLKPTQDAIVLFFFASFHFLFNFGQIALLSVLSTEIFPTRFRATLSGLSSALGMLGAIAARAAMGTVAPKTLTFLGIWLLVVGVVMVALGVLYRYFVRRVSNGPTTEKGEPGKNESAPLERMPRTMMKRRRRVGRQESFLTDLHEAGPSMTSEWAR